VLTSWEFWMKIWEDFGLFGKVLILGGSLEPITVVPEVLQFR